MTGVNVVRKLFFVCLLFAAGGAWAEWERVGESGGNTFYIDPTTIRKDGDLRKFWGVQDLKERDNDGEMSRRYREEYDCKGERKRFLSGTTHTEPMAGGKTLQNTGEPSPWSDIRRNTLADTIMRIVCAD